MGTVPRTVLTLPTTLVPYGFMGVLHPSDAEYGIKVEIADDNGSGAPNLSTIEVVRIYPANVDGTPEDFVFTVLIPNDGARHHLRAYHFRDDVQDGTPTAWIRTRPVRLPIRPPKFANEGARRVDTFYAADGSLLSTVGILEGAAVHQIFRHREEITVNGPDADGDVGVTFGSAYQNPPAVFFRGGQYVSFSGTLSGSQRLRIQALDVSPTGFTSRLQICNVGSTTPQTDDFGSGNLIDAVDETAEVNLDPGAANDDTYTVNYRVSVTANQANPLTFNNAKLTVAIETNDGGGWVERATFVYSITSDDSQAETQTWDSEARQITVSGLGLNDDIRLRAKSFTTTPGNTGGSFAVRGADAGGSNPDTRNGVLYTTATDTTESAIPSSGDHGVWITTEVV